MKYQCSVRFKLFVRSKTHIRIRVSAQCGRNMDFMESVIGGLTAAVAAVKEKPGGQ